MDHGNGQRLEESVVNASPSGRGQRVALHQGDFDAALDLCQDGLCEQDGYFWLVYGLDTMGRVAIARRDYAAATDAYEQMLERFAEPNDHPATAVLHLQLALLAQRSQRADQARYHEGRALEFGRRFGIPRIEPWVRASQAWDAYIKGDYTQATTYLDHAYALSSALDDRNGMTRALTALADVQRKQGDHARALATIRRAAQEGLAEAGGSVMAGALKWGAVLLIEVGRPETAARVLGAAITQYEKLRLPYEAPPNEPDPLDSLRAALGEEAFRTALNEGKQMGTDAAAAMLARYASARASVDARASRNAY